MKGPDPEAARADPHPVRTAAVDPLAHLARRLVGERDREDAARIGARRHQPRQPIRDDPRLARPGARHHQQRPGRVHHRLELRRVQLARERIARKRLRFQCCARRGRFRPPSAVTLAHARSNLAAIARIIGWMSGRFARGQIARGVALAGTAALLFGVTTPLLKRASDGVGPLLAGSLLYLGAVLGAGLMAMLRRRDGGPAPSGRGALARLAVIALVGAAVAPTLLVVGLGRTDAATASLLLALEAPFTLALARLLLHERIGGRVLAAALLILGGGVVLVSASLRSAAGAAGVGLIAAAALAWALDNVLSRPLADRDPLQVVALKGLLGGLASGVCGALLAERVPDVGAAIALLAVGAIGYGLSLQLFLRAQRVIGAARTASVFAVAPFRRRARVVRAGRAVARGAATPGDRAGRRRDLAARLRAPRAPASSRRDRTRTRPSSRRRPPRSPSRPDAGGPAQPPARARSADPRARTQRRHPPCPSPHAAARLNYPRPD